MGPQEAGSIVIGILQGEGQHREGKGSSTLCLQHQSQPWACLKVQALC